MSTDLLSTGANSTAAQAFYTEIQTAGEDGGREKEKGERVGGGREGKGREREGRINEGDFVRDVRCITFKFVRSLDLVSTCLLPTAACSTAAQEFSFEPLHSSKSVPQDKNTFPLLSKFFNCKVREEVLNSEERSTLTTTNFLS